jgi:DNA-directed RNA polymerase subunit RPC12/RpoP
MTMDAPYYWCEDCGATFTKTELLPDIEEDLMSCPECGGLDIALVDKEGTAAA